MRFGPRPDDSPEMAAVINQMEDAYEELDRLRAKYARGVGEWDDYSHDTAVMAAQERWRELDNEARRLRGWTGEDGPRW